jgi:putative PIN family toxin of toxin-antitoxin system
MYKIVVDANIWIKYARAKNIKPLLSRFIQYNFLPVINNYLLSEIFDALVLNKWMNAKQATLITEFIAKTSLRTVEKAVFALSPDAEDNYLFDLAIQNNCVFIITNEKKLLSIKLKPLPIFSGNWFIKHFPS